MIIKRLYKNIYLMDSVINKTKVRLLTDTPDDLSAKVTSERMLSVTDICKTAGVNNCRFL